MYSLVVLLNILLVVIGVLIIRGILVGLLCQVGPTCGFYCISWCLNKSYIKVLSEAERIVKRYHKLRKTNVGEIFNINTMKEIIQDQHGRAEVIDTPPAVYLKELLKKYYVIIPIAGKLDSSEPHFVVIRRVIGNYAITYNPQIIQPIRNVNKMLHTNKNLDDYFNWSDWKSKQKPLSPAAYSIYGTTRRKAFRKKIEGWISELNTYKIDYSTNLNGKVVLVSRDLKK